MNRRGLGMNPSGACCLHHEGELQPDMEAQGEFCGAGAHGVSDPRRTRASLHTWEESLQRDGLGGLAQQQLESPRGGCLSPAFPKTLESTNWEC